MLLIDAGTSYIKLLDTELNKKEIYAFRDKHLYNHLLPSVVTGHNASMFKEAIKVSELVALTNGVKATMNRNNFTVLDIGSRDMKLVSFTDGNFEKCDWNTSCGAMIGFTIELMMKYFNKEPKDLPTTDKMLDITCGLLGITKFFDGISKDETIEENLSALINGMASYSWHFAGKPNSLFLSGGLTENPIFIFHLKKLVKDLTPIGRFALLDGLRTRAIQKK